MKNLSILFFIIFSLFAYSQKQNEVAKIPSGPVDHETLQTLNASNFKVPQEPGTFRYSFNLSGTYFRVEIYIYKNSISENNLIIYNSLVDESEYEPIVYPQGFTYNGYAAKPFVAATTYILVLKAWEYQGQGAEPAATATLTYTPPVIQPTLQDFSIGRIQIFRDKFNVNDFSHLFFDSQNTATYPGTALNKDTKYKFVVTINSPTVVLNTTYPEPIFTFSQGLSKNGSYPSNVTKSQNITLQLKNASSQTIEFFDTTSYGSDYDYAQLAFHVDKGNLVPESNENNNIKIVQTQLYPRNFSLAGKQQVSVNVYDVNGNFIKKLETTSDDSEFIKIKSKLGSGKYILKSSEKSIQVLVK